MVISTGNSVIKDTEKSKPMPPVYSKKYMESRKIRLERNCEDFSKSC